MPFLKVGLFFNSQLYLLPVMIFLYELNGVSASVFVLFHSIFFITAMVLSFPCGVLADKWPRKYFLMSSSLLEICRLLLLLCGHGIAVIFFAEVLFALSRICVNMSLSSYVYDYCQVHQKKMLNQYGKMQAYMAYGTAFSSFVCMVVYPLYGLMPLMIMELSVGVLSLLCFLWIPNLYVRHENRFSMAQLKQLASIFNGHFPLNHFLIVALLGLSMTSIFVATFQPLMKLTQVPSVFFGAVYFMNHFLRGFFAKRSKDLIHQLGSRYLIALMALGTILSCFLIMYAFAGAGTGTIIAVLTFVCLTIGLQFCMQIFAASRLQRYVPYYLRSTSTALCDLFIFSGRSLFLLIFGIFVHQSFILAYVFFVCVLIPFFLYLFYRKSWMKKVLLFFKR